MHLRLCGDNYANSLGTLPTTAVAMYPIVFLHTQLMIIDWLRPRVTQQVPPPLRELQTHWMPCANMALISGIHDLR
jgi:hypothetical protein